MNSRELEIWKCPTVPNQNNAETSKASINAQPLTKGSFLNIFPSLLAHTTIKQNTQMLGYKGLNSCHRQTVCMVLLKLSKQFIRARWMKYLERAKFPHFPLLQNTLQTM